MLTAHLLGPISFTCNGTPLLLPPSGACLLAALLLRPGACVERRRLADAVGAEGAETAVRRRVNSAVWRLRRSLDEAGDRPARPRLDTVAGGVALVGEVWVDAAEFGAACGDLGDPRDWTPDVAAAAARGVDLYRGDFLEGFHTDWALAERGRLADLHLTVLVRLAQWHRLRGEHERVVVLARRAVDVEPLREDLHRLLIRAYGDADLPDLALRQLARCRAVLAEELGVAPLPETVAAAHRARAATPAAADLAPELHELRRAQAQVEQLARQLAHAVQATRLAQERILARIGGTGSGTAGG